MSPPFYDKKVPLSRVDNKGQGGDFCGQHVDNVDKLAVFYLFFANIRDFIRFML